MQKNNGFINSKERGEEEMSDFDMELDDAGCDVGGYSEYEDEYCGCSICAQCGYRFVSGDDVLKVKITGDIIHEDCFIDYADDNVDVLSNRVALRV